MKRLCACDKTEDCRLCWLYYNNPKYRAVWGDDPEVKPEESPEVKAEEKPEKRVLRQTTKPSGCGCKKKDG